MVHLSLSGFCLTHAQHIHIMYITSHTKIVSHQLSTLWFPWQQGQGSCATSLCAHCHVQLWQGEAAGCRWERTEHNTYSCADCTVSMGTSPPPTTPSHLHQRIPPPFPPLLLIAPAKAWQAPLNASCSVWMCPCISGAELTSATAQSVLF